MQTLLHRPNVARIFCDCEQCSQPEPTPQEKAEAWIAKLHERLGLAPAPLSLMELVARLEALMDEPGFD